MAYQPKYVAHRGFSMRAPENTIAAFELAGQSGFWGIECDTYCTVDGRWIVHHDRTVDRMTNGSGKTKDFTFEEIRNLMITSGNGFNDFPAQRVPALEEVLSVCQTYSLHAFIEIEEYHEEAHLQTLVKLVEEAGMMDNCSFICFQAEDLKKVRKLHSTVPLGFLSDKSPCPQDLELVHNLGNAFLDYEYKVLTPETIKLCHDQGVPVSVWTVNSITDAGPFIAAGVDFVTTDTDLHRMLTQ